MQCALFGNAGTTKDTTLYSTFSPCVECSKMSLSVGIKRIVILNDYAEDVAQLLNTGIMELVKLDPFLLKPWTSSINQESEDHILKQ
jgi:dCMP deaminase